MLRQERGCYILPLGMVKLAELVEIPEDEEEWDVDRTSFSSFCILKF